MHYAIVVEHANGAELDPHRNRTSVTEKLAHLLGSGSGCEIPVEMRMAQHGVTDGAAHTPGLETPRFEPAGDLHDFPARMQRRHGANVSATTHYTEGLPQNNLFSC